MVKADKKQMSEIMEKRDMTKAQLIKRLQELARGAKGWEWNKEGESPESAHINADTALLKYIGDKEVAKAFYSINKWYA